MQIYTSYFGNLKNLPDNVTPVSICAKAPSWWTGKEYKKLAPKYSFFSVWKQTKDNDYYTKCFKSEVLACLNASKVLDELNKLAEGSDVVLMCYEKVGDFCHRHIVSEWLLDCLGIEVPELSVVPNTTKPTTRG